MHLVVVELTFEVATILPLKQPLTVLLAFIVLASVGRSVDPVFFTLTVVLIVKPFTFILCAISVEVGPFTIRLVILPVAHIHVAIGVYDPTEALLTVVNKVAVVARAVWPDLGTTPVANRTRPLTCVLYVIVDERLWSRYDTKSFSLEQLLAELIVPVKLK